MKDDPSGIRCHAGYNQFVRLVRRGCAVKVCLARDADRRYSVGVREELANHPEIVLDDSLSAEKLAELAGVEVPTAVLTFTE